MGIFSALIKTGAAKKVYDEARKPENQQKMKDLAAKARSRTNKPKA